MIDKSISSKSKNDFCSGQLAKDAADKIQFDTGKTSLVKEKNCTASTGLSFTD